jgi:hypothetical protein
MIFKKEVQTKAKMIFGQVDEGLRKSGRRVRKGMRINL